MKQCAVLILLILSLVVYADSNEYALPPSKAYFESCEKEALRLHPGSIEMRKIIHRNSDFWMRYDINAYDDSEWIALCDLSNGKVVLEQQLISIVFSN